MQAWILALIALCARPDSKPETFAEVARAIDDAAYLLPLPEGRARMVLELVALAAREGHLDPFAVGHDAFGASYGLFQIHETTLGYLGATVEDAMDPARAAVLAARLVFKSHNVCRARAREECLGWYASGGPTCDVAEGLDASRNRVALADALLARAPPPRIWTCAAVVEHREKHRP